MSVCGGSLCQPTLGDGGPTVVKGHPCAVREWPISSAITHRAEQYCSHKELR